MDDVKDKDDLLPNVTRRKFVTQAVAATSAVAIASMLPSSVRAQQPACTTETLRKIGEIKSRGDGKLRGVIKIKNGPKNLPGYKGSQLPMMRYFEGYDLADPGAVWPPEKNGCNPGPTLRVSVGQQVQITFLNQVDVGQFPGLTLDNAETGATAGCDPVTNATTNPPDKNWYPGTRGDSFPNCFHASSSANLHFHGTHVTPDAFGDNVLISVRPDPKITEKDVEPIFKEVFEQCERLSTAPPKWKDVPASFQNAQAAWVEKYDLNAIWKGTRGPVRVSGQPDRSALPHENQLTPANEQSIAEGRWPPFFIGGYPSCFRLPKATEGVMGQAPGTHWYHAHKHGSTSINLFNGLAGALIIEGDYDRDLAKIYPRLKETEKVLVVQVFTDMPNLERAAGGLRVKTTNGTQVTNTKPQQAPAIVMRPGEIQLWRIVNAQVMATLNGKFTAPSGVAPATAVKFRQIAQDGVQFNAQNYLDQPLTKPVKDANGENNGTQFSVPPGNRVDILVQAPALPSGQTSVSYELSGICNLVVCGTAVNDQFPVAAPGGNYPKFPPFLDDITPEPKLKRTLTFDWEPYRIGVGPAATSGTHAPGKTLPFEVTVGNAHVGTKKLTINVNRGPYWMIDEEQFSDDQYYQTMVLGDVEEWKIINTTTVAHPFHIHVNPFQVVESFDPTNPGNSYKREKNGIWQDVIAIPSALQDKNGDLVIGEDGKATTPGFVRIRSRFVDFIGSYVLHCHILAHEDRGMMQLVRVVDGKTPIKHH